MYGLVFIKREICGGVGGCQTKYCLYLKIFLFVVSKESIIIERASVTVYNYLPEAVKAMI